MDDQLPHQLRQFFRGAAQPRAILGVLLVALAGGPTWTVLTGRPVSNAWAEFEANAAAFVNSPIVRLLFGLIALYLLFSSARSVIRANEERAEVAEANRVALLQRHRDELRDEFATVIGPTAAIVRYYIELKRVQSAREKVLSARNALTALRERLARLTASDSVPVLDFHDTESDGYMTATEMIHEAADCLGVERPQFARLATRPVLTPAPETADGYRFERGRNDDYIRQSGHNHDLFSAAIQALNNLVNERQARLDRGRPEEFRHEERN